MALDASWSPRCCYEEWRLRRFSGGTWSTVAHTVASSTSLSIDGDDGEAVARLSPTKIASEIDFRC